MDHPAVASAAGRAAQRRHLSRGVSGIARQESTIRPVGFWAFGADALLLRLDGAATVEALSAPSATVRIDAKDPQQEIHASPARSARGIGKTAWAGHGRARVTQLEDTL
jgi:hypothetical protein